MHQEIVESMQVNVQGAAEFLRDCLRADPAMLNEPTEAAGRALLYAVGQAMAHKVELTLPAEFDLFTVNNALRAAGNHALGQCGEEAGSKLEKWAVDIKDKVDHHYAEDQACGLVEELGAHWYVEKAAQAYLDAADEEAPGREQLERELSDFTQIAQSYRTGLLTHANGLRALTWAALKSNYVSNRQALLPAGETPWFLDRKWYDEHGAS